MKSVLRISGIQKRWRLALLGLCGSVLLACGGSGSDPAAPQPAMFAATTTAVDAGKVDAAANIAADDAAHGRATYRVVSLGAGEVTELPKINARDQVAFSLFGPGGARAAFFNGAGVRDLGTLGGAEAYAPALNDAGQVAGYAANPDGNYHAFRWSQSAGMVDLGTLDGAPASKGLGINDGGQVSGYSEPSLAPLQAFVWNDGAGIADLGRLGADLGSAVAQAINDKGMVAGYSDALDGNTHGFAWTKGGGMVDIGTVGGIDSYATLINNAGQIAGYSAVDNARGFNYHGFVWSRATGIVDIGTLSGLGSAVLAINASGQVAGVSDFDVTYQHAISWTQAGGIVDLGTLGGTGSRALAINKQGVVVGLSDTPRGSHAFLWTRALGMVDLNTRIKNAPAGLVVTDALAISDSGAIVAFTNAGLVLLKPGAKGTDAPVVGPIGPGGPIAVAVGARAAFSAGFTDQNSADRHGATWSWGDGCGPASAPGTVTESNGVGTARGVHTFCTAGVFSITLTVTDNTGRSATVTRDVEVRGPAGAAVAGAGGIKSPRRAAWPQPVKAALPAKAQS